MSEKNEVGLNVVDIQAVIAAWIVVNDGCKGIYCTGGGGKFAGTVCPLSMKSEGFCPTVTKSRVVGAKDWLAKYHQQKAEAAEAEKHKVEAAKKQEQEAKQKPKKICGNCKYIHEVERSENMTAQCDMKNSMVPILFDRCPDFEPRAAADQFGSSSSEGGVDAAAYAERIAQFEKDNANLADKCERLTEQRNRLANSLIEQRNSLVEAMRRVKEVERENAALYERISAMLSELLCLQWKAETGQLMPFSVLNDIEERFKRIRQSWVSRLK